MPADPFDADFNAGTYGQHSSRPVDVADVQLLGCRAAERAPGQLTVQLTQALAPCSSETYLRLWVGGVGGTELVACPVDYGVAVLQAALREAWQAEDVAASPRSPQILILARSEQAAAMFAEAAGYLAGAWRWVRNITDLRGVGPRDAIIHAPSSGGWHDRPDFDQLMVLLHRLEQVGVTVHRD
jgi:hypothetical protein